MSRLSVFSIHLSPVSGLDTQVVVDGVDITSQIDAIRIEADVQSVTRVWLRYAAAYVTVTGEGELTIDEAQDTNDLCIACNENPVREWPNPVPDDFYCMWTEWVANRPLYCQDCYDAQEEE